MLVAKMSLVDSEAVKFIHEFGLLIDKPVSGDLGFCSFDHFSYTQNFHFQLTMFVTHVKVSHLSPPLGSLRAPPLKC